MNSAQPLEASRDQKSMERLTRLSSELCELAREAGRQIMHFYGAGAAVTWKKDASPLTLADRASHDVLVNPSNL